MKKLYLLFALILLVMPFVAATTTEITVRTAPFAYVMVRVFEAGDRTNLLQTFQDTQVDTSGQITVEHTSEEPRLDIEVYIKTRRNGPSAFYQRYERIDAGQPFIVGLPEEYAAGLPSSNSPPPLNDTNSTVDPVNQTETNSTNQSAIGSAEGITGNAIVDSETNSKIWYYIVGAVILIALIVGFLIFKNKMNNGLPSPPTNKTHTEKRETHDARALEAELRATRARLEQSTKEIARLKNEDRIKEMERKIQAEKDEIRRLRQGL